MKLCYLIQFKPLEPGSGKQDNKLSTATAVFLSEHTVKTSTTQSQISQEQSVPEWCEGEDEGGGHLWKKHVKRPAYL